MEEVLPHHQCLSDVYFYSSVDEQSRLSEYLC